MKISPCPFCGSSDTFLFESFVECRCCDATGPVGKNELIAIAFWNNRPPVVYNGKTAEEWYRLYAAAVEDLWIDVYDETIKDSSTADAATPPTAPCQPPSEAL